MAFLGDLVIRMKADTADFRSDLGKAQQSAQSMARGITSALTTATAAFAGLSAAAAAYQVVEALTHTLETAENFNKLAQKTGIAAEELSAYSVAAKLADVPQEALDTGLKKLAVNMAAAAGGAKEQAAVFSALGVKVTESNGSLRKTNDVLDDVGKAFEEIKDGPGKAALAVALFGKSGDTMIPLLNNLRESKDEARKLGVVIGSDFARNAEEFNDNMKRVSIAGDALKITIANALLPRLVEISKEFVTAAENGNKLLGTLKAIAQASGISDPKRIAMQKEMMELAERTRLINDQIEARRANRNMFTGAINPRDQAAIDAGMNELRVIRAREELLRHELDAGDPGIQNALNPKPKQRAAPILDKGGDEAARLAAAELKQYQSAAQKLEEQLFGLNQQSTENKLVYETTIGSLHTLTQAHKDLLVQRAADIDRLITAIAMQKQHREGLDAEAKARETLMDAVNASRFAYEDENRETAFRVSLIGKSAAETERMIALHQLDLSVRRQLAAVPASEDSGEATNAILAAADRQRAIVLESVRVRREAERDWATGARGAIMDYLDAATNAAQMSRDLFTNAFRSMEEAIISFVKTGKLDFKSLADSIITDLIRIQIRRSLIQPLSDMLNGSGSAGGGGGLIGSIGNMLGFGPAPGSAAPPMVAGGFDMSMAGWAEGGPIWRGQSGWVGENGPEWINAGVSGNVTPNGGGGATVYIDATGADAAGLARVEAQLRRMDATFERRAVAATVDANMRGRTGQ